MMLGIVVTVAIPLALAWTNGQFLGQRNPPSWARKVAIAVTSCGLGWCALPFIKDRIGELRDQADPGGLTLSVLAIAWVAGSCIAAAVALQDHGSGDDSSCGEKADS